jgi:MFS family permease
MAARSPLAPVESTADLAAAVAPPDGLRRLPYGLRALSHRDFRLFWTGAIVSTSGSQMQLAALGWVVAIQTHSAFRVSLVAFAGLIPMLVLSPVGGALADRRDRRRLLLITQIVQMAQAFLLFGLWHTGHASYWVLFALAAATGIVGALTAPAWQALVPDLVPMRDLQNAVMLNSTQFNISRATGPMLAGFTIARWGPGLSFFYNAVSFLAVILALVLMSASAARELPPRRGYLREFHDGVRYARGAPGVVVAIVTIGVVSLLGVPIISLIPIVAVKNFHTGAQNYGLLAGSFGIGAIGGAFVLGLVDGRRAPSWIATVGLAIYAGGIVALGLAPVLMLGILAMACVGAGFLTIISTLNSAVQMLSDDHVRGRVLSLWLMVFGGCAPIGVIVEGVLADHLGPRLVVTAAGGIVVAYLVFMLARSLLPRLDPDDRIWRRAT